MWYWLLNGCAPCEADIGQLQVRLQVASLVEAVVGTLYITGESEVLFTKTSEDGMVNLELPSGEYWIEAEYLPLSCYSREAVVVTVEECAQASVEIVLDRCAFLP